MTWKGGGGEETHMQLLPRVSTVTLCTEQSLKHENVYLDFATRLGRNTWMAAFKQNFVQKKNMLCCTRWPLLCNCRTVLSGPFSLTHTYHQSSIFLFFFFLAPLTILSLGYCLLPRERKAWIGEGEEERRGNAISQSKPATTVYIQYYSRKDRY